MKPSILEPISMCRVGLDRIRPELQQGLERNNDHQLFPLSRHNRRGTAAIVRLESQRTTHFVYKCGVRISFSAIPRYVANSSIHANSGPSPRPETGDDRGSEAVAIRHDCPDLRRWSTECCEQIVARGEVPWRGGLLTSLLFNGTAPRSRPSCAPKLCVPRMPHQCEPKSD